MSNQELNRIEMMKEKLSFPYKNGIENTFSDETEAINNISPHLAGLTYRKAIDALDLLKIQVESMAAVVAIDLANYKTCRLSR